MQNPGPAWDLLNQDLCFNKIPGELSTQMYRTRLTVVHRGAGSGAHETEGQGQEHMRQWVGVRSTRNGGSGSGAHEAVGQGLEHMR